MSRLAALEVSDIALPMQRVGSARAWLLATAVAASIGLVVGYRLGQQAAADPTPVSAAGAGVAAPTATTPGSTPPPTAAPSIPAALPLRVPSDPAGALASGELEFEQLAALVRSDAAVRADLWTRYRAEADPLRRQTLLALLAEAPASVLADWAATLVADADAQRRRDGYRLLTGLPIEDATLREQALRALQHEPDPIAQAELAQGLQPGLLASEDAEPLARALETLAQAGDPGVRAAALPVLSQWSDRAQLEAIYLAALGDSDAAVRGGAIAGINTANVSTPSLRGALFQLAANPAENVEQRHAALLALSRFRLTRAEVELYRMLQAEVPVHPDGG